MPMPLDGPEVARVQLTFAVAPRFDRRLVHRQHGALPNGREPRVIDGLQQRGRALPPLREGSLTQSDARMEQSLVLAIEGQRGAKFIAAPARQAPDVRKAFR